MTEIITKSSGCPDEWEMSFGSLSKPCMTSAWCVVTEW
jgi:hypothetical protein